MSRRSRDRIHGVRPRGKRWLAAAPLPGRCAGLAMPTPAHRATIAAGPEHHNRALFRCDAFGDEQPWTDRLRLNEVTETSVDPLTALKLGLKVDVDAPPDGLLAAIEKGAVNLTDPATALPAEDRVAPRMAARAEGAIEAPRHPAIRWESIRLEGRQ